jgi:hypothetical protein
MSGASVTVVVCLMICGPAQAIIWYALIADLNDAGNMPALPLWGRASWSQTREVLRRHRLAYPNSMLRRLGYLALGGGLLSVIMMAVIFCSGP